MDKPYVFISHITEEAKLAELFKTHIQKDFLGLIDVFVSSDNTSISVGSKWLNDVDTALKAAKVELIVCSEESVKRPWINFEAGAGWVKGIPVVPICHTGMRVVDLPIPLNMLQAIEGKNAEHIDKLYGLLAEQLGSSKPIGDFEAISTAVQEFEHEYGVVRVVRLAVVALIGLLPDLSQVFVPTPAHRMASGDVPDILLDKMRPHLDSLQSTGMLTYSTGPNALVFGATGGGNVIQLKIHVQDAYYQIASEVNP
jgi:hypothetical protein